MIWLNSRAEICFPSAAAIKTHKFQVSTDPRKAVFAASDNRRLTHIPLPGAGELFVTRMEGDYDDEWRMLRFGARFVANDRLDGVAYGIVFVLGRNPRTPPDGEQFYDWCDRADAAAAAVARWILDSGRYDERFLAGDVLTVDAYEFRPDIAPEPPRVALRTLTAALKRRFRRLDQAVVVVHPGHLGEPPKITGSARRIEAYRRALERALTTACELHLGACLNPKNPTQDILIGKDRSSDQPDELVELVRRTGLHRML